MRARLEVGAVIRRFFDSQVEEAPVLLPAAAVVFVFTGLLSAVLLAAAPALALVSLLISLVATTLFTGMIVELVADVRDGRRDASVGRLLQAVMPVPGPLRGVGLVGRLGAVGGVHLIRGRRLFLRVVVVGAAPGLGTARSSRES